MEKLGINEKYSSNSTVTLKGRLSRAIDSRASPVKDDQTERVSSSHEKGQNFAGTGINHSQDRGAMTEIVPQGAVAPNAVVDFVVAQSANARIPCSELVVQVSENLWHRTLGFDEAIENLPRGLVLGRNRRHANGNVIAHVSILP
jgi:hypothetical protein